MELETINKLYLELSQIAAKKSEQAAWRAGLDAGREQGRRNEHAHQPPSAPVGVEWPLSLLRAGHWREVHIGRRYMRLEITYDFATWKRLMAEVESALAQQPAACPMCDGTGEADSGGIMPWGAPAMIPCECQQPAAVDAAEFESVSDGPIPKERRTMKQEPGRQQPGISGLQAGEDVNEPRPSAGKAVRT